MGGAEPKFGGPRGGMHRQTTGTRQQRLETRFNLVEGGVPSSRLKFYERKRT